jgi:putative DNA methylase
MARAIEDSFPIRAISQLAERESWRKEIYRPIYYVHKWWARRLGSVFRAIILACCAEEDEDIESLFYQPVRFPDVVVFDPFMGSGTTVGEALKLGCRAIGRDINPVSVGMVTTALQEYSRSEVKQVYKRLESTVAAQILSFYKTILPTGGQGDVLYYFWVKTVPCPHCDQQVELFKSRVFATHAYPRKHPEAKSLCPSCGCINDVKYNDEAVTCSCCATPYDPQTGSVRGTQVTCPSCLKGFKTIDAVRRTGVPPAHKLYAKMVLTPEGDKKYLPADDQDLESYRRAEEMLSELWDYVPQAHIVPGYNTNQVLNYNYRYWHQMFNARQLVSISLLVREVRGIPDPRLRMLFAFLLSGTLEFNNMFCSFKGEGTGAVRHMFSHHILKPELTPIEANLWGTPRSSGAFSTLFQSRILRALDYKDHPFELRLVKSGGVLCSKKVFGLSRPVKELVAKTYTEFSQTQSVYLSCGDSSKTDIPDGSVDLVITDPPFFDNVHYSQLADFFHVWLRLMLEGHEDFAGMSTRSAGEVQDTEAEDFTRKLASVLRECHRVLADSGLLVLTYHHSRIEGWTSVYRAIREAGFYVTHSQPVKAEMDVSVPIQQSKSPVHFDLILVCRKAGSAAPASEQDAVSLLACLGETKTAVLDLRGGDIEVSLGDIKVMLMGAILSHLSALNDLSEEVSTIYQMESQIDALAEQILIETDSSTACSTIDHLQRKDLYQPRDVPVYQQLRLLLEALAEYTV